jgi:hypothetical protein
VKRILVAIALTCAVAMPACSSGTDDEKPGQERQHEILQHRTSGFWTSNRPAEHGAYRWRLLAIGVVLATATGYILYRLLRRASADRFAGAGAPAVAPPPKKSDDPPDIPNALP